MRLASLTLLVLAAGCAPDVQPTIDAARAPDGAVIDAWPPPPDAPPPPFDAGPPPQIACDGSTPCELPESWCLDDHYLVYYTGGACEGGWCQLETEYLYCQLGCVLGGCEGGFT